MDNQIFDQRQNRRKKINWWPFIGLLLLCYAFLQIYLMNTNAVDTVKAVEGYINDSIISQGIVCRNEVVLTMQSQGAVDYLVDDGERISKGHLLANVYPSYTDVDNMQYLRNRQQIYDDIVTVSDYVDSGTFDVTVTRKQLNNRLIRLSQTEASQKYDDIYDTLSDLTLQLNKINVVTGKISDFTFAKQQLEDEINATQGKVSQVVDSLYSPYTGYFIKYLDGFENVATVDNFIAMSYEEGFDIINNAPDYAISSTQYGKIITDYKWYVCTYIDSENAENLYEGKSVSLSLSTTTNEYSKATVEKVINTGDKTLVVVMCTTMNYNAATARITDCEILFKQYKGIKIPKSAVHFENGEMGVYVKLSNIVNFKKISPIYEDENYMIVPLTYSENNQVKLYDSIIVKGRNLYDGKYL